MRLRRSLRLRLFGSALIPAIFAGYGLVAGLSDQKWAPGAAATYLMILAAGLLGGALLAYHTYAQLTQAIGRIIAVLKELSEGRPARISKAGLLSELRALAQAANATSDALAARQHDLHDQRRRTALLTRLAIDLRASLDQATILRDILMVISLHSDDADATIVLVGPDGAIELAQSTAGGQPQPMPPAQARRELARGPAARVWRTGGVVLANDAPAGDWDEREIAQPAGSAIALPLAHGRATFGVLTISYPMSGHFSSHDLLLFEAVAAQASMALSAARLRREAQHRRDQALLLPIGQSLAPGQSAGMLAAALLERSAAAFDAEATALFLARRDGTGLNCFATYPATFAPHGAPAETLAADLAGAAERAWHTGVATSELLTDNASAEQNAERDRSACVALPLRHNGDTIGVFALARRTHGTLVFSADTWAMLAAFGNSIAAAFARRHLNAQQPGHAETSGQQIGEPGAWLARSRDPMHTFFDHLPDGLVLLNDEGRILIANDAFCEDVLGILPRAAIGQDYAAIIEEMERCGQITIEPHPCMAPARRARCTAGARQRWYDIDRYAVESGAGGEEVIERWRDITRQEEQNRELAHDEQLTTLARLAASVVHEIGNPLQSVCSCIDLSREDPNLAAPTAEYLKLAGSELRHMSQILGRLRDLYRLPLNEANHE